MKQGTLVYDHATDRYDIRFDLDCYYGGLHCGECFDVMVRGKWKPTRIEMAADWYLKNLNAIVWLYRGEVDKYKVLLAEYHAELADDRPFAEIQAALEQNVQAKREEAKAAVEAAPRKERKTTQEKFDKELEALNEKLTVAKEAVWLTEKFGEGVYQDIPGLCKVASRDTILNEKGASLTPGAYVGVAPVEDDGVDFAQRMKEIHKELLELQAESNRLMETISKNLEEMGV